MPNDMALAAKVIQLEEAFLYGELVESVHMLAEQHRQGLILNSEFLEAVKKVVNYNS